MAVKWLMLLSFLHLTCSLQSCPEECSCDIDIKGRIQTICIKGGLKAIPIKSLDPNVGVFVITGPRNYITISPIFNPFKRLELLRITDSNVQSLGKHSFWGIQSLRILDLSRNNITTVADSNFRGQDGLHDLDLSYNKITILKTWTFQHLKDLRRLNLAVNSIVELVPKVFYLLGKLKHLDLSGNPLIDLPPDVFRDIMELKELKCRNCNIKKINPQVYNLLPQLGVLDLGDNQLKYLEKDEFKDIRHLSRIKLDGNQLSVVIDNLFEMQKNLEYLDLSRNRLAKVTNGAFVNLSNLTYLDLSYNKLVKLEPASVVPLKSLHALNISGNIQMDLYDIRETFQLLQHLKTLFIAEMGPLPMGLLVPFAHLSSLNLSGNHLVNVSLQILDPVTSLELLDLSRNQLNGFDEIFVAKLQQIKDVRLENNPLICDRCRMGYLIEIARTLEWNSIPVCFLPKSLRGAPISHLMLSSLDICTEPQHDESLNAASTSHNFLMHGNINILAFIFGALCILVAIAFSFSISRFSQRDARYTLQEEKRSDVSLDRSVELISTTGAISSTETTSKIVSVESSRVCTIDELVLTPSSPSTSNAKSNIATTAAD